MIAIRHDDDVVVVVAAFLVLHPSSLVGEGRSRLILKRNRSGRFSTGVACASRAQPVQASPPHGQGAIPLWKKRLILTPSTRQSTI